MEHPYNKVPRVITEMLESIRANNRSGAAEILPKAAEIYSAAASGPYTGLSIDESVLLVDYISSTITEVQPGMAGLLNMTRRVSAAVRQFTAAPLDLAAKVASEFAVSASHKAAACAVQTAQLIAEDAVVLTHSRSSTVLAGLLASSRSGRKFSLIATESRPMLEGRQLAEAISNAGIPVTIIVDAAAALVMDKVDLVMVGADRVAPDHVLNKVGTGMIALAARSRKIPVYCVADTTKFISPPQASARPVSPPATEVWPDCPGGISIFNRYFEEIPIEIFTAVVAENGPLKPSEAAAIAARS